MTENHDAVELEAMASNPHTDWDVLHWIAENHPELRPAVAANPGTYQELVDALGTLGDSDVDAAIAARHRGRDVSSGSASTNPLAGMYDTTSQSIPAFPAHEAGDAEPYYPADPGAAAPSEPQPAPAAAAYAPPASAQEQTQRRRAPWALIAAAILCVVGVGAAVALLITFLGGDDEDPVADPASSPTEEAPAEEEPEEADEGETEATEPAEEDPLEEARTAVAALPEESACEADEDSGVVAAFITAGTDSNDFPGEDAELLEDTFAELQSDCSTTHAASVFTAARGSNAYDDGAPEGAQAAMDSVGTEWADRAVGTRDAEPMSGFTAQGGNVECEFDDGVTCTVYNTNPQLCDTGSTYRMTVEGVELDCDAQLEPNGQDTLSPESSATDGFLVCTEMGDRLSCYNSVDPFGFEMSNTGNYAY